MDLTMQKSSLESERRLKMPWRNLVHPSIKCVPMLVTSWRQCIPKVVSTHVETVCLLGREIVNDKNVEYAHVDYEPKDAVLRVQRHTEKSKSGLRNNMMFLYQIYTLLK